MYHKYESKALKTSGTSEQGSVHISLNGHFFFRSDYSNYRGDDETDYDPTDIYAQKVPRKDVEAS